MEKLVLIDGNAIIHRAYHALPKTMTTRAGEQTNAVYGFTTTLIKVLEDLKPEYLAVSFDLAGPTFRHEKYAEYKATRVKADQELYDQIPRVKQVVETMGIPIYEKQGFEADDTIGTIVRKVGSGEYGAGQENQKKRPTPHAPRPAIYIVSGDKDIYQLINGNVFVYSLRKGLSQMQVVDRESIKKEYHLQPEDFIDLKALAGDPSDNIPGVPGVGPKTATMLLQQFDSLEKLYKEIDCHCEESSTKQSINYRLPRLEQTQRLAMTEKEIEKIAKELKLSPRVTKLLVEHREQAFLSQHLATIHKDVPIDFDLEKARFGEYDKEKLKELFEELGFRSLLRRFGIVDEKPDRKSTGEQKKKDDQLRLL